MIINHPVLNRFSPSLREVVPERDDDKLNIPNSFQLNGLPPEPMYPAFALGAVMESSFNLTTVVQQTNNGTPSFNVIIQLKNGYWNLDFDLTSIANYTIMTQSGDVRVAIDTGNGGRQIMTINNIIGAQRANRKFDIMIPQTAQITFFVNSNTVGQDLIALLSLIANKLL